MRTVFALVLAVVLAADVFVVGSDLTVSVLRFATRARNGAIAPDALTEIGSAVGGFAAVIVGGAVALVTRLAPLDRSRSARASR